MLRLLLLGVCAAWLALLTAPVDSRAQPAVDYSDPATWLCRPGRADACATPLTSTVVAPADGQLLRRTYAPDPAAPIDCFYVYPTVSQAPTGNADMAPAPELDRVARSQFARFGARCRTFAPIYRQVTVAKMEGRARTSDPEMAYGDVRAAWRHYLEHDNGGRGVVLIGHSQGAQILKRLAAEEIDGKATQRLLVSVIILGAPVQVPDGKDVGGSFHHIPICRSAGQAGCVIAYSTFLSRDPPIPGAYFGRAAGHGFSAACVNPAALLGREALDSELPTSAEVAARLGTPLVENPGLVLGACSTTGAHTFLAVTIKDSGVGSTSLSRALTAVDARMPGWGLHVLDVNLGLGDLVEIVGRQGNAWIAANR